MSLRLEENAMHRRRFITVTAAGLLVGCNSVPPARSRPPAPPTPGPQPRDDASPVTVVKSKLGIRDAGRPAGCLPTSMDLRGPYYSHHSPTLAHLAAKGGLRIEGVVKGPDCAPIPGAVVHVWQADEGGKYYDDRLRGRLATDGAGGYRFETVRPGNYREPDGWRPAHIHFEVTAPGYQPLVTQLYFAGDPYLAPNDSCSVCRSDGRDRIITLKSVSAPYRRAEGEFEIRLARA